MTRRSLLGRVRPGFAGSGSIWSTVMRRILPPLLALLLALLPALALGDVADLRAFGEREGLLLCSEGAACLSAARRLRHSGWLAADDEVVVLNTGAGNKYPDTVSVPGA